MSPGEQTTPTTDAHEPAYKRPSLLPTWPGRLWANKWKGKLDGRRLIDSPRAQVVVVFATYPQHALAKHIESGYTVVRCLSLAPPPHRSATCELQPEVGGGQTKSD